MSQQREQRPWYVVAQRVDAVPELVGPFDDEDGATTFADRWRATTAGAVSAHAVQPRRAIQAT